MLTEPHAPLLRSPIHDHALRSLRLTCRPVEEDDAPFYEHLFALPGLNRHRPGAVAPSANETGGLLERDIAHWRRFGFGRYRMTHADHVVGLGGLSHKTGLNGLNLSYHLLPDWWGFGLASEFVRAALDFASDELQAESVYGLVRPSNGASIRVLQKAGFKDVALHAMGGSPMRELRRRLRA